MLQLLSSREVIAMGVHCRIDIAGQNAPHILDTSLALLHHLETSWSRFRQHSDISRLNNSHGRPIRVTPQTMTLIEAMKTAHIATSGSFNPTRLPQQIGQGDTQSLVSNLTSTISCDSRTFDSLDAIELLPDNRVVLPQHMTLDAGGIGKGLAADLIAQHARDNGATSVTVNLGGDIRTLNAPSSHHDTAIDVTHPLKTDSVVSTISLHNGAIATSARTARHRNGSDITNHIMGDDSNICGASVIASTALWADVWTKHLILNPNGLTEIETLGLAGLVVFADGSQRASNTWKDFEQC